MYRSSAQPQPQYQIVTMTDFMANFAETIIVILSICMGFVLYAAFLYELGSAIAVCYDRSFLLPFPTLGIFCTDDEVFVFLQNSLERRQT